MEKKLALAQKQLDNMLKRRDLAADMSSADPRAVRCVNDRNQKSRAQEAEPLFDQELEAQIHAECLAAPP